MTDDRPSVSDRLEEVGATSLGEDPPPDAIEAVLRKWRASLNGADDLRVQVERDALVDLPALSARQVDAALRDQKKEGQSDGQGEVLALEAPEPWPEVVVGVDLLEELRDTITRYLALPNGAAVTIALWVVHAHSHDAGPVSPVLAITSPEKRCGKTTLLELLSALVPRPVPASNMTAATVFRVVEEHRPTLLVDEADTFLQDGTELRGILNSGHRRSMAFVPRCVGDDHEVRHFRTWAPKAVALIGKLPDTLADRSIEIRMRRRAPDEEIERLRLDRLEWLEPLRRRAWTWSERHEDDLLDADPPLPSELHDRARDNWRPLIAIADEVGGPWPERARKAVKALTSDGKDGSSLGTRLLANIRSILQDQDEDRIRSKHLVERLCDLEEAPWDEYKGRGLSTTSLANFLKSFDVSSKKLRFSTGAYRGYEVEAFNDAFRRYLPSQGGSANLEQVEQSRSDKGSGGFSGWNTDDDVPPSESGARPKSTDNVPGVPPSEEGVERDGVPSGSCRNCGRSIGPSAEVCGACRREEVAS